MVSDTSNDSSTRLAWHSTSHAHTHLQPEKEDHTVTDFADSSLHEVNLKTIAIEKLVFFPQQKPE